MTSAEGMTPPKYIAKHWPKQSERELIEEFLQWAGAEHGASLTHEVEVDGPDGRGQWQVESAPWAELLESFFAARETP